MGELQDIIAHAPATLPTVDRCGDHLVIHGETWEDYMAGVGEAAPKDQSGNYTASWEPWPYPRAFLYVGSSFNEREQWDKAWEVLERGLRLAPMDPHLASEAAVPLERLHRPADALAVCERPLGEHAALQPKNRARLQRCRGYALVELHRLDEAEAAYKLSLTSDPGNKIALSELDEIALIRKGQQGHPVTLYNSGTQAPSKPQK
jgi:tetratricopeptide (TPR) repeat protein